MSQYDPLLGKRVAAHLASQNVETPASGTDITKAEYSLTECFIDVLDHLGMDRKDDSVQNTPARISKMYCREIFTGLDYANFPKISTFDNKMQLDELVICKNADVLSVCEHHFVPFVGKAHIAYIPNTTIVGLSKINRVVDFFSRRPQVQERLTLQIFYALQLILETSDIAVVIRAEHMCVRLRGVKQESETITSKLGGKFFEKQPLREEFMSLVK